MAAQLVVIVVVEALDGRFLDRAVHPLDLSVGPGMLDLGEPVLDAMFVADAVEDVHEGMAVRSSWLVNWMPLSVSTVWMA